MAETDSGHGESHEEEHAAHDVHLPDPSPWPLVAGLAALVLGLALVWWSGDRDNQVAGVALGAAVAFTAFAIAGWAWEDSGMLRKTQAGGEGHGMRAPRFTQVVTFLVPEGKLAEARESVMATIEDALGSFQNMEGFVDLRIVASPEVEGPAQVLVETVWAGRDELEGYEASQQSVLDVLNDHPDEVVPGSVQAFDMQVVRDTKETGFKFSWTGIAVIVVGMALGGGVLAAGLSAFDEGEGTAAPVNGDNGNGNGNGGPFDGTIVGIDVQFDIEEFRAPPSTEITITFDNQDNGIPHNIVFFGGPTAGEGERIAETELEDGPVVQELTFTTPGEEGSYAYWCDVHPTTMVGTMIIEEGAPVPGDAPPANGGGNGNGGAGTSFTIAGIDNEFETTEISAPADTEITITFENEDDDIPHNIVVFDGPDPQDAGRIAETEIENGPVTQTLTFTTPSEPGEYAYWCDVHPTTMLGTLQIE